MLGRQPASNGRASMSPRPSNPSGFSPGGSIRPGWPTPDSPSRWRAGSSGRASRWMFGCGATRPSCGRIPSSSRVCISAWSRPWVRSGPVVASRPAATLDIGPAEIGLIVSGTAEDGSAEGGSAARRPGDDGRAGSGGGLRWHGSTSSTGLRAPCRRRWSGGHDAARVDPAVRSAGPVDRRQLCGRPGAGDAAMTVRVVLAEDNFLLREGVRGMLAGSGSIEVVGSCGDLAEALESIDTQVPDVVLTDIRMPPNRRDEGIVIAAHCRRRYPTMGVVLLSQYAEASYVRTLLVEGTQGRGYLLKERVADLDDLLAAIRAVAAGGSAIDPKVVETLVERSVAGRRPGPRPVDPTGAGGPCRHRAGPDECGNRVRAVSDPARRGEAHQRHLHQVGAQRRPDQSPTGSRHSHVPGRRAALRWPARRVRSSGSC